MPLRPIVEHPHRNLSPWIVGALLAGTGLAAIIGVAVTSRRASVRTEAGSPPEVQVVVPPTPVAPAPGVVPPCDPPEADPDPATWTMSADHLGPFAVCAPIDAASVRALMPGYQVEVVPFEHDETLSLIEVSRDGRPVLSLEPKWTDDRGLGITIWSHAIATPWGTRVGDKVRAVRARHRDLECTYGAAEADEAIWCERSGADGWLDSLIYKLDLRGLARADRHVLATTGEIAIERLAGLRVASIHWRAVTPR